MTFLRHMLLQNVNDYLPDVTSQLTCSFVSAAVRNLNVVPVRRCLESLFCTSVFNKLIMVYHTLMRHLYTKCTLTCFLCNINNFRVCNTKHRHNVLKFLSRCKPELFAATFKASRRFMHHGQGGWKHKVLSLPSLVSIYIQQLQQGMQFLKVTLLQHAICFVNSKTSVTQQTQKIIYLMTYHVHTKEIKKSRLTPCLMWNSIIWLQTTPCNRHVYTVSVVKQP